MKMMRNGFLLLVLFSLYYLIPLEFRHIWQPDETRYAEISREMLVSGNWVVPHFFDLRYFEKPIAGYWINNLSQLIFGHNNFAVRFGSVFSTTLTALLVYWLTLRIWRDRTTALMAGVIFLSSLLVYGIGSYAVLDPMITMWLTAAMCCYWLATNATTTRKQVFAWLLMGFACGMGFMTKGFLALAVPVVAIVPWAIQQKRFISLLKFGLLAVVGAVIISAPWAIAVAQREPDFWHYFFWVEHIQRFAEDNAQHKAPFWYYLPILLLGCLPWLALLPGALRNGWCNRNENSGSFYLLSWVVMPLIFFSIAKGKLPTYILPCFAPLAALMARQAMLLVARQGRALWVNGWINLAFGLLCVITIIGFLAPWSLLKHSLYGHHELLKVVLAGGAFLLWAACGFLTLSASSERWAWSALCPLGLALVVGFVIPDKIVDSKQPQQFIQEIKSEIGTSRFLLANNPGIASGLAWELRRSDIILYQQRGEMQYGLSYADAQDKFVAGPDFPQWLAKHRHEGQVTLVLLLSRSDEGHEPYLPKADFTHRQGRIVMYQYNQTP
ncbi:lipid IV(A) 4-amino-4-deoxy-L-arabinosyltransferase [Erwinia tracheiphila]|uniref:Undecaprenyl phosphate-alpha-4-amino-4-deoxy-L-arabinose arabinosyl transferase n=1 Tax=Erwinia tracheiphila TaxID=65700 RepID=A0A0M2KM55_9GAMM|nr:lipid IV(A) 4-amino-4-deoxy-L-arabinosyltransferase [Erwinia tracheiphila]AXF75202.1 lipid IV(A) 4-amino-4-deoxy-L-arabinosyltransferase [Erwinia tracheiphila]EOS94034.1 4-amino-4-deoxy-L-arabinose transferase [Erwinia tracheiphila PSU-1]KKF38076.1 4-amino-4-deoxy-L-arabinose transferase [Erwinia tracheiphila]UIA82251.1 lipid IV(A) 4-amino-4-deoxy-L-arabinosyltransferase [Erwinia tracheiphila]UIA89471.1 lipid IV(A) 4-amino-4-deoxy-L-arabinosyltransferase [Erwinia tracheiphila]